MPNKTLVHRLLYLALVDIRARSEQVGDKSISLLADLFHVAALQLAAASSEEDHFKILEDLKQRAAERGCSTWLENAIQQIDR